MRSCAEVRSLPNGFSITTRRKASSDCFNSPAWPRCSTIGAKNPPPPRGRTRRCRGSSPRSAGRSRAQEVAPRGSAAGRARSPRPSDDVLGVELRRLVLGEGLHRVGEVPAPALVRAVGVVDAPDRGGLVEEPAAGEVVERRHQEALGQVAAGAEDHDRAGRGRLAAGGGMPLDRDVRRHGISLAYGDGGGKLDPHCGGQDVTPGEGAAGAGPTCFEPAFPWRGGPP